LDVSWTIPICLDELRIERTMGDPALRLLTVDGHGKGWSVRMIPLFRRGHQVVVGSHNPCDAPGARPEVDESSLRPGKDRNTHGR